MSWSWCYLERKHSSAQSPSLGTKPDGSRSLLHATSQHATRGHNVDVVLCYLRLPRHIH
jgi:hypothetical protein